MKIKLNWIKINNFKGIKSFRLDTGGNSATIQGKNGIGKTTLADAWFYLWCDTDSLGAAKFNALQLDDTGATIDQQDAVIEAQIQADGQDITLKKIHRQKWQKKRGQAQSEMIGHTTDHFWNDVPISKKKYTAKIEALLKPELFRSLSDCHEFCGRMHPDRRREILLEVAGDVSSTAIYALPALAGLKDAMGDRSPDDFKKMLQSDRRKCSEQLDRLPGRIDELEKSKPDTAGMNETEITGNIADLDAQIDDKRRQISEIKSGQAISEARAELAEIKSQIAGISNNNLRQLNSEIERLKNVLRHDNGVKQNLLAKWHDINNRRYEASDHCYACGQQLPTDQIERQVFEFKKKKDGELDWINQQGKRVNENIKQGEQDIAAAEKQLFEMQAQVVSKSGPLEQRQRDIEAKIESLTKDTQIEIIAAQNDISELEAQRKQFSDQLSDLRQVARNDQLITERRGELAQAAKASEQIARQLWQLEKYHELKAKALEQSVNNKFQITSWKLFEKYIGHDGSKQICEPLRDGVPYNSDLNTGSRINVGLDCIKTLQAHYDLHLPVWVDNAESVTEWVQFEGQVIKLVAQADIDELEVRNG